MIADLILQYFIWSNLLIAACLNEPRNYKSEGEARKAAILILAWGWFIIVPKSLVQATAEWVREDLLPAVSPVHALAWRDYPKLKDRYLSDK